MNKKEIINNLSDNLNYTEEQKDIIRCINEVKKEWNYASQYFDMVSDPKLVDYAIYKEAAAKARYLYLLNLSKEKGIRYNAILDTDEASNK